MDEASETDLPGTDDVIHKLKSSNGSNEGFKCPVCGKIFGSKKNMNGHLTRHSTTGSFPCNVCDRIYTDKKTLENHTSKFNGECVPKPLVPPILCNVVQSLQLTTCGKEQKPKTVTTFKCPDCDYVGKKKYYYRAHRKNSHSEPGCFKCPVCDKIFVTKRKMRRHLTRHSTTGSFPCSVCGLIYNDKRTLLTHAKKHKEGWVHKTFSCDQCSKTFVSLAGLKFHIESHSQVEGKYLCSICGKRFRHKNTLNEHYNAHLKIKPFACDMCDKTYGYRKGLKDHKLTHSKEKTYVCPICSKAFRQKASLLSHSKTHKTTKDYHCRICGKEFAHKGSLLRHDRVHSGEKPFVCEICDNRFSDSSIIRRHMILVHKQDAKHSRWKVNTHKEKKTNQHQLLQEEVNSFTNTKS